MSKKTVPSIANKTLASSLTRGVDADQGVFFPRGNHPMSQCGTGLGSRDEANHAQWIHLPSADLVGSAGWLINGFPAKVLIWTAEDWARLTDRPNDAQPYPNGVWCALRME